MLDSANNWLIKSFLVIGAFLALLISFLIVADVIGRGLFLKPVQGTKEMVEASVVLICFLQAAYAIRSGGMIAVDVFITRLSTRPKALIALFGSLLGVGFFFIIFYGGIDLAVRSWVSGEFEGEGAFRIPSWPARFMVVLGSALAIAQYLILSWHALRALIDPGYKEDFFQASSH
ncbi:MAG: TRAP transporter small permease subunit [Burkholderiaceae bacterium]